MRGQKDQEKQAELSKRGPRPYMRHEVIPQGLIENQRLRVSDETPGAGREKKKTTTQSAIGRTVQWETVSGRLKWPLWGYREPHLTTLTNPTSCSNSA